MADPALESRLEVMTRWLEKVAENTAAIKNAAGKGGGAGSPGAAPGDPPGERFERAMDALGKRFEGALQRWARTPVEKLVNASFDKATQVLNTATNTVIGQGRGLVARGMSGTLEQAQNSFALDMLGRQLAAIFLPVTQGLTYLTNQMTMRLASLSGAGQDRIMGAGLGAIAGGHLGGPMGAVAGAAAGSMLMGGGGVGSWERTAAGAGVGAYVGGRLAGLPGAAGGAVVGAAGAAADGIGGTYTDLRARGHSMLGAGARAGFAAMHDAGPTGFLRFGARALTGVDPPVGGRSLVGLPADRPAAPAAARREVTPFSADMTNAGEQHFQIQRQMIRATAGEGFEDGGEFKWAADLLLKIIDILLKIQDPRYVPPAASAEAARP
jgi:hypothetical protein